MNAKLALVDSIENIKEKITSQEYKELLENLAKIKVTEKRPRSKSRSETSSSSSEERRETRTIRGPGIVRAPSGFAMPTIISPQLAAFIGVPEGTMVARPDVTKALTNYIKDNHLQNPERLREIDLSKPGGQALRELLNVPEGEQLNFFNMQKYLKVHFPPRNLPPPVSTAPES
jgi:chromatin remodeling complex protein RSC6